MQTPIVSTATTCIAFVLDWNPRFFLRSIWPRCIADYWAFPLVSLGPAVISSIGFKPGDYGEHTYSRSDSLLADVHRSYSWRMASDTSGSNEGWRVDTINIVGCAAVPCPTPTPHSRPTPRPRPTPPSAPVVQAAAANHSMKSTSPLRRNSSVLAMPTCYTYLFLVRRHHAHPQAN
jgi:hypothetical protein